MQKDPRQPDIRFRDLEGRRVVLALADGSQLEDASVISAGRGSVTSVWLDRDGTDLFVSKIEIARPANWQRHTPRDHRGGRPTCWLGIGPTGLEYQYSSEGGTAVQYVLLLCGDEIPAVN